VNGETRKLIKRSSRAGDLKERFKVREMSSISTLEFAWENRPSWWDETDFCWKVAKTNKLELLKWAREEKKCEWDEWTINRAAEQGNLEMVKYCVANECPMNWGTAAYAAQNGHLHILEYLVERKYDKFSAWACENAAKCGHLDCLKYLRETAKAPWNYLAVRSAHKNKHTECLQYLLDNDCPLPFGWSYEGGKLYTSR
jgi:hypothetical protein